MLAITVDGTNYTVRIKDLSAIDAKDFRAAVGVSLGEAMTGTSVDLDIIAGLVWLVRRKRERGLPYLKVAKEISYGTEVDVNEPSDDDPGDDDEADDPGEA